MKLSALKNRVKEATIVVGPNPEDKVVVGYMPGKFDYAMAEKIQALATQANPDENVAVQMLLDLVDHWDLQDDDGNDLAVTKETIRALPMDFVAMILVEVRTDMVPDPLKNEILQGGSPQKGASVVPLTTTRSSEQRGSLV